MAVSDQMDMALSESGRQDPVSGNDVPMGSLPEEVRDDVPAMLSEGEYVVPADVLRFYGLKFFEDLRETAKMEIARMADEGRIGGEPIAGPGPAAPTPDQPNGLDLSPEEMQQLESVLQASEGGAVGFNVGGLGQSMEQAQKSGLPAKESSMNVPADTDMLIDRIMGAVQKNPALKQKLADKGVGFMEGGVVQGYAHGGDNTKSTISDEMLRHMQEQQLAEAFNPYDWLTPGTGGGYGSSSFQDAESIVQAAQVAPIKKKKPKEEFEGGPDNPGGLGKTFSEMTAAEQQNYSLNAQKMQDYKGPFSWAVNALGKFNQDYYDKQMKSKIGKTKTRNIKGTDTYTAGISANAAAANAAEVAASDDYGGFTGSGAETGAESYGGTQYGGSGEITGLSKGAFISRRKKT